MCSSATSGNSAGTAASVAPVYGSWSRFIPPTSMRSEPSIVSVGRNGTPIAAARKRRPRARWLHSSSATRPDSTKWRRIFETPHGRPIDIHAVTIRAAAPATMRNSPSVHVRLRARVSPWRRCRRSSRTSAIGVREKRHPPTATWSPSLIRATASSSEVSFGPADFGLSWSRRRAATKSYSPGFGGGAPSPPDTGRAPRVFGGPSGGRGRDFHVLGLTAQHGGEVALTGVVRHRHDRRELLVAAPELQRRDDVAPGRDATEDPLLGGEPPRHRHALVGGRRDHAGEERHVEIPGHEPVADALDPVGPPLASREERALLGLHRVEPHARVALAEEAADAGQRAAAALRGDERPQLPAALLPDLGAGPAVVRRDVVGVVELAGHPVARRVACANRF